MHGGLCHHVGGCQRSGLGCAVGYGTAAGAGRRQQGRWPFFWAGDVERLFQALVLHRLTAKQTLEVADPLLQIANLRRADDVFGRANLLRRRPSPPALHRSDHFNPRDRGIRSFRHSRTHRRMPMPSRLCHLSGQNGVRPSFEGQSALAPVSADWLKALAYLIGRSRSYARSRDRSASAMQPQRSGAFVLHEAMSHVRQQLELLSGGRDRPLHHPSFKTVLLLLQTKV